MVEVHSAAAAVQDADLFLTMLLEFSSLGAAMRRVLANTLTNPQVSSLTVLSYKTSIPCFFITNLYK